MRPIAAIIGPLRDTPNEARSDEIFYALEDAQKGDLDALRQFYRIYQPIVTRLCGRLLDAPADIEDATQNVFVRAFRALPHFRGESSLKTWLYRIACNVCLDALRVRRQNPAPLRDDMAAPEPGLSQDDRLAVHQALRRLPPDQQTILALYYWESLTCEEIGSALNLRPPAVKMRLFRARSAFRGHYEEKTPC